MRANTRRVLSSSSIVGTTVQNLQMENLGEINELMIDISEGRIAYAVLSFDGFLGIRDN